MVYRNFRGRQLPDLSLDEQQLFVRGQSFSTEEEALTFLELISSQSRWRLKLGDPSVHVERPYGVSVTDSGADGRTFSLVLAEAFCIDVQGEDVPTIGNRELLP